MTPNKDEFGRLLHARIAGYGKQAGYKEHLFVCAMLSIILMASAATIWWIKH